MSRRVVMVSFCALLAAWSGEPPHVRAETSSLIAQDAANRLGLERSWFSRIQLDTGRSRVHHLTQYVSSTRAYTVFEVEYDGGKAIYSERDLDNYGEPLGKEKAEKLAREKEEELQRAGRNPKQTSFKVPEITLLAMTDSGLVQSIDAQTGRSLWSTKVGNPNYPSDAPGGNENYVAVVNGSTIYLLDQTNGNIVWQRKVRGAPGAGPAVSDKLVVVPMVNGAVEAYQINEHRMPPWVYKSHGRAVVQPIYTGRNIAWPTDRGFLYVCEGNNTRILYRLETSGAIVDKAAALLPTRIVSASTDGYVYCIHEQTGNIIWRFSTGEPILEAPVVIDNAVYIVTDESSMFRIDGATGLDQWWTSGIRRVVAASDTRVYCLDRSGRLVILDPASGSRIGSLVTEMLDLHFVNTQTDRIILGTRSGMLQCLHEFQHHWPLVHAGVGEKAPVEAEARPKTTEPDEAAPPPSANPFGAPAGGEANPFGANPFGGGSGGGGGGAGGGSSDPFGGSPF